MPHHSRLTPEKDPVPIVQEAGWAPGPVWTGAENLTPPGFDSWTVQSVASRYPGPPTYSHCVTKSGIRICLLFEANTMTYTDCGCIRGIHRRATTVFAAQQQNVGCHRYEDDREVETVLTRWLITGGTDLYQYGTVTLVPR